MLLERISEMELQAIDTYRNLYAMEGNDPVADVEDILKYWNKEKGSLYKMFGNNLMISKPINISRGADSFNTEIQKLIYNSSFIGMIDNYILEDSSRYGLRNLIRPGALVKNKYEGASFKIMVEEKLIDVQTGCKPIRVLAKIAKALNLVDTFEYFRLEHSRILNQKFFRGNLVLSIHPLDYMTMSDNDSKWSSCMSWKKNGCYRLGTVEMMNSPYVVVAYLTSDTDMELSGYNDETIPWNNKKWRSLFIVHPDCIAAVKGYPYKASALNDVCFDWLRELAENFWTTKYLDKEIFYNGENTESGVPISFETDMMYNDFDDGEIHEILLSKDASCVALNYSGVCNCMGCGETHANFYTGSGCEERLICCDCGHFHFCELCEEEIVSENGEIYEVDGLGLCESCYNYYTVLCADDNERHLRSRCGVIQIIEDNTMSFHFGDPVSRIYVSDLDSFLRDESILAPYVNETFSGLKPVDSYYSMARYKIYKSELNEKGLERFKEE